MQFNKKTIIISLLIGVILMGVVGLTLVLISQPQDTRSRADDTQPLSIPTAAPTDVAAQSQQSCPNPAGVENVQVEYPNCIGDVCNFTEAGCSWDTVSGATQYQITVTEVETSSVIVEETVEASTTRIDYPITQNRTYKCDVAAVNNCGAVGVAGTHSLLCETDAIIEEPTPTPTVPPQVACGMPCSDTSQCQSGLTCVVGNNQGYCAIPSYQDACLAGPSVSSCCQAPTMQPTPTSIASTNTPTPIPTIPPTGILGDTMAIGAGVLLLILLGTALVVL